MFHDNNKHDKRRRTNRQTTSPPPKKTNPANNVTIRNGMMVRESARGSTIRAHTNRTGKQTRRTILFPITETNPQKRKQQLKDRVLFLLASFCFFLLFSSHSVQTTRTIHKRREEQEAISLAGKWIAVLAGLCTAHGTSSSFRSLLPSFASFVRHNNGTRKPIKR